MDSPVVYCPAREAYPGERFRIIRHVWPWEDGMVVHKVVLQDINGFKLSVPAAIVVPVNKLGK